jgi:hypothetical protein
MALVALFAAAPADHGKAEPLHRDWRLQRTTITDIGYRLGDPDTGSAISYANGGVQISTIRSRRFIDFRSAMR